MSDPVTTPPQPISGARLRQWAWIALMIAILLAVWGIVSRVNARNTLIKATAVAAGTTVVEGLVNGTPVRALCGKIWVPGRDPKKYPLCQTCKEIAEQMGWAVPSS